MNTKELFRMYGLKWESNDDRGDTLAKLIRSNKYWNKKMKRIIKGKGENTEQLKAELSKSLLSRFGRVKVENAELFYSHFPRITYTAKMPKGTHEEVTLLVDERSGEFKLSYGVLQKTKGYYRNGYLYFETMIPKIAQQNEIEINELSPIIKKARQEMEQTGIGQMLTYNFFDCLIEDYQTEKTKNKLTETIGFVKQMAKETQKEKGKEGSR